MYGSPFMPRQGKWTINMSNDKKSNFEFLLRYQVKTLQYVGKMMRW